MEDCNAVPKDLFRPAKTSDAMQKKPEKGKVAVPCDVTRMQGMQCGNKPLNKAQCDCDCYNQGDRLFARKYLSGPRLMGP